MLQNPWFPVHLAVGLGLTVGLVAAIIDYLEYAKRMAVLRKAEAEELQACKERLKTSPGPIKQTAA